MIWRAHYAVIFLCFLFFGLLGYGASDFYRAGPLLQPVEFTIPNGATLRSIAQKFQDQKIIRSKSVFYWMVRLHGEESDLKAGRYLFPAKATAEEVMRQLTQGNGLMSTLTIPEGLTNAQVWALMQAHPDLVDDGSGMPQEGTLFPETYTFSVGTKNSDVIKNMQQKMGTVLDELWAQRPKNFPLQSPKEAVILASIVEKEAGILAERPHVAGVFLNRLRLNMALQADPTVIYAVTDGSGVLDRALTKDDLKIVHPHNTYRNKGLPPTPIANVSRSSLEAVFAPLRTRHLYFVADGKGGHYFSRHLKQHRRKVQRYRRG